MEFGGNWIEEEWLEETDYYNEVTKVNINKTYFSIEIEPVNSIPLINYKGAQIKRINIDDTKINVKASHVILEGEYAVSTTS